MEFTETYLREVADIASKIDPATVEGLVEVLCNVRQRNGRVFAVGVGGSAANASHLVNDLRQLAGIQSCSPADNVSELTARINDQGWDNSYADWLRFSGMNEDDALFVLSVGGGSAEHGLSRNIVAALEAASQTATPIIGIVGREDGETAKVATHVVVVPKVNDARLTPHAEEFQSVICHLLVSHPRLRTRSGTWEQSLALST